MNELETRRRAWIAALRSGRYQNGMGGLFVDPNRDEDEILMGQEPGFCCIGVALSVDGLTNERLNSEESEDYTLFRERYDVSEGLMEYLAAMNDGNSRGSNMAIRQRNHPFIARFLEIIWRLS